LIVAWSLVGADPARAFAPVLGRLLRIYIPAAGRRIVRCEAVEFSSVNMVVGDPLTNGATVRIIANGDNPQDQTIVLPPGTGWRALSGSAGWLYHGLDNNPVQVLKIRRNNAGTFLLRLLMKGTATTPPPGIAVVPPGHGTDGGMIFTINGGATYCMPFGGAAGGTVYNAPLNLGFRIRHPTFQFLCPAPATTTTTTTTSSTTSTT